MRIGISNYFLNLGMKYILILLFIFSLNACNRKDIDDSIPYKGFVSSLIIDGKETSLKDSIFVTIYAQDYYAEISDKLNNSCKLKYKVNSNDNADSDQTFTTTFKDPNNCLTNFDSVLSIRKVIEVFMKASNAYRDFKTFYVYNENNKVEFTITSNNSEGESGTFGSNIITITRSPCLGNCPAYELFIYNTGTCQFVGEKFVNKIGAHEFQIEEPQIKKLFNQLDTAKFQNINFTQNNQIAEQPIITLGFSGREAKFRLNEDIDPYYIEIVNEIENILLQNELIFDGIRPE